MAERYHPLAGRSGCEGMSVLILFFIAESDVSLGVAQIF